MYASLDEYVQSVKQSADELDSRFDSLLGICPEESSGRSGIFFSGKKAFSLSTCFPKPSKGHSPIQDSVQYITKLRSLTAGSFKSAVVISMDAVSGVHHFSLQDIPVSGDDTAILTLKEGTNLWRDLQTCTHRLPVAIGIAGDPLLRFVAALPLPFNVDAFIVAGFLKKSGLKTAVSFTQELEIPEDFDYVVEGFIQKSEESHFFHSTCVTHRHNAVISEESVNSGELTDAVSRFMLKPLKTFISPMVEDIALFPEENLAVVKMLTTLSCSRESLVFSLCGTEILSDYDRILLTDCESDISDKSNIESMIAGSLSGNLSFGTVEKTILEYIKQ